MKELLLFALVCFVAAVVFYCGHKFGEWSAQEKAFSEGYSLRDEQGDPEPPKKKAGSVS